MERKRIEVWEEEDNEGYSDEDFARAQARLEAVLKPLQTDQSDRVLYHSIEAVVLGSEPKGVKESMVICMLETLFLRFASKFSN